MSATPWLLEVRRLQKFFEIRRGFRRRVVATVRAVDDVSFAIAAGRDARAWSASRAAARPPPRAASCARWRRPAARSCSAPPTVESSTWPRCPARRCVRLRPQIQMIFQDPFGSLNPRMTIFDNVAEPLLVNGMRRPPRPARARRRAARADRPAPRAHAPLPARVLGRPAPAHRHRARARHRAPAGGGRRAGLRAGRLGAGAGAESPPGAPAASAA